MAGVSIELEHCRLDVHDALPGMHRRPGAEPVLLGVPRIAVLQRLVIAFAALVAKARQDRARERGADLLVQQLAQHRQRILAEDQHAILTEKQLTSVRLEGQHLGQIDVFELHGRSSCTTAR